MLLSVVLLYILMASNAQQPRIQVLHEFPDSRDVNVSWSLNANDFVGMSRLAHHLTSDTVVVHSYDDDTVLEISVQWNLDGEPFQSKYFPVFKGTCAHLLALSHPYVWHFKTREVGFSHNQHYHFMYTWEELTLNQGSNAMFARREFCPVS